MNSVFAKQCKYWDIIFLSANRAYQDHALDILSTIKQCTLYSRIKDNIATSENGKIYLNDIQNKLMGQYSSTTIARAMKREFKGMVVKVARRKPEWAKLTRVYMGVDWKSRCNPVSKTPQLGSASKTNQINQDHSYIKLVQSDSDDMSVIFSEMTTSEVLDQYNLSDRMKLLLEAQLKMTKTKGRRWNPEIIRLCLTLFCRSPKNYEFLSKSGYLILPSSKQIQKYKNVIDQEAGLNKSVLEWMKNEAELQKVPPEGYEGGLLLDEMSIQEDLQLKRVGTEFHLIGFVECCLETDYMSRLSGKSSVQLATHVLQLLFVGQSGYRFPVAHFSTTQTSAPELYLITWKAVKLLSCYGFSVTYISLDGAQTNRDLMKMFLPNGHKMSETITTLTFPNVFDPSLPKLTVIMDYSHMIKKIRNNISKSGHMQHHKKLLLFGDKHITWDHWVKAYQWDISSNVLKVHQKLTQDHFSLNSQLKMRNKLAEDVLDENMLHLMRTYKHACEPVLDHLDSSIILLENTSKLVAIFRDNRPIRNYEDPRLEVIRKVLHWFRTWERSIKERVMPNKEKERCLLSSQTREDIVSCLLGFDEMCRERFHRSFGSVVPARINSDAIENIFSQQRGIHNGANTNPDYLTYCRSTNAIILGQCPISRKSNAADASRSTGAQFLSLKAKKRQPLQDITNRQTGIINANLRIWLKLGPGEEQVLKLYPYKSHPNYNVYFRFPYRMIYTILHSNGSTNCALFLAHSKKEGTENQALAF